MTSRINAVVRVLVTVVFASLLLVSCKAGGELLHASYSLNMDAEGYAHAVGNHPPCVYGAVENLGAGVNTPFFEGSPTVSADERTPFFTSERIDGRQDRGTCVRSK
jgi:hypothetical protein